MKNQLVHIIDDDDAIRDALSWLFFSHSIPVKTYQSGTDFLQQWDKDKRGCILLDIRMPDLSGIEVFDQIKHINTAQPVIFMSGHGDIALAVSMLKQGAYDFIEKPFNEDDLINRVKNALQFDKTNYQKLIGAQDFHANFATLSHREQQVFDLMTRGMTNREIADTLEITLRTVEVHRSRVIEKMKVRNVVELTRLYLANRPELSL